MNPSGTKARRPKQHLRILASLMVAVIAAALVWAAQEVTWLQPLELWFHDQFVSLRARWVAWKTPEATTDPRVVIVAVTAGDLAALDYPLTDESLAKLIEAIAAGNPRAIGVDLYRDLPVPRDGSGAEALRAAFQKHPEAIAAFFFGPDRIPPPRFLEGNAAQIAFNDFPYDGRMVRRALLYLDEGETTYFSLSARLAILYLERETPPRELGDAEGRPGWVSLGGRTVPRFERTDGAYVRADDRGYQYLLDFCGPGPSQFTAYSVKDTLEWRTPRDAFRDKIVIIGAGDRSLNDAPTIPLLKSVNDSPDASLSRARPAQTDRLPSLQTSGEIFGVELHAAAVSQILRLALDGEAASSSWSNRRELAWLLGAALLGGVAGYVIRCPWWLLLSLGLLCSVIIGLGFWFFVSKTWIPVIAPLLGSLLAAVLVNTREGGQEQRDRHELMSIFNRNLSPAVAESLWDQREAFAENNRPKPRELTVTVLFTDLVGFSTISEGVAPAVLMEWLNEYMELMARQVELNGGVVMKYIGDAIMGVFGVPLPRTTAAEIAGDAANAIQAALGMQSELARLNARWEQAGRQRARMRVGIFTGPVVAGCLGSATRLEYTTIGDTVNTASRLESWEKEYEDPEHPVGDCRILIGESTQALVSQEFRTKWVGEIKLKGKDRPTNIHRVLGTNATAP